ncbi:MAG: hypothetical protein KDD00_05610 [Ignavibacteriae bacterium]|nr:hypothetical protein [Ignavibacteriota bacterium]
MCNLKYIFILFLSLIISGNSFSQTPDQFTTSELRNDLLNQNSESLTEHSINKKLDNHPDKKSPYLGALFSGIIPGTGEIYAKSFIKGAIFLALEAGLWIAYGTYESDGNSQTAAYQSYANENWSMNKYANWLVAQNFSGSAAITDPNTSNLELLRRQVNVVEAQNFSHQLPEIGSQQYYELIGKYQNFVVGWADADPNLSTNPGSANYYGTYQTQMYEDYSYSRQEANNYYDKANTSLTLVIVNHLLSAADAAWSVSMFNKDLKIKTSVHMENKYSLTGQRKMIPVANVNVTF